jgi:multisubunit Na+/H+ antiporter MnhB subunit
MLFWVIAIPILWVRPKWKLLAALCAVQATLLVALVWGSSGFYQEAIERYPQIMGDHWAALVASVPLNVGMFAVVGGLVVIGRKLVAGRNGRQANVAANMGTSESRSEHRDQPESDARNTMKIPRWLIWAALGVVVALLLGYVLEGRGQRDTFAEWLTFHGYHRRGDLFSAPFWAAAGFAIGALGSILRQSPPK